MKSHPEIRVDWTGQVHRSSEGEGSQDSRIAAYEVRAGLKQPGLAPAGYLVDWTV